jgi:hypothetical protein
MYIGLHVKYLLFLSDFNGNTDFLERVLKVSQIGNFIKIGPMEAELFHTSDRRDKANSGFSRFVNVPKRHLLSPSSPF